MRRKAYGASAVNRVDWQKVVQGRDGQALVVGTDVGKYELRAVARWPDGQFERPWQVSNPEQVPELVGLLSRLAQGRSLFVAMEPSGTYGDALRQALSAAQIPVRRVSPKAAHDYAEIFDGVPSQHDGKDAAVIAELAALGKAWPWPYTAAAAWEEELASWVDWMDAQRRIAVLWLGRIEALLARHWPEATRVLLVSSATLLRALACYGGPAALAADPQGRAQLRRWGGARLSAAKAERLWASARTTVGVRQGEGACRRLQRYAQQALQARREKRRGQHELQRLIQEQAVLQAQAQVVGTATACVLWACVGDPRQYPCGEAYRKAMGLNLAERSSGIYQGRLKISKRGSPLARQWLYFAALRLVQRSGVRPWYQAKKARDGQHSKGALVGVMRKLVLALYHVAVHGAVFDARKLFPGATPKTGARPSLADRR